jgi:hypothetical protein
VAVGVRVAVAVAVGVAVGRWVAVGVWVADDVAVGSVDGLADGLVPALGVTAPPVLLFPAVGVGDPVTEGENMAGVEDEDVVQPEITTEATMVKAPQPMAVSRTPSAVPAMVVRTFIEPPRAPGRRRSCSLVPVSETGIRKGNAWRPGRYPGRPKAGLPKAPTTIKVMPADGADMQWRVHHWNIRLRE